MAGALGLDLEQEVLRGRLDVGSVGEAVLRCAGCSDPDGCEAWLAGQDGIAGTLPIPCRNVELFAALQEGKQA